MLFKFVYFVKLNIDYQPEKFQSFRLSRSSFTERLGKHNDNVIMTSFHIVEIPNLHIL